jgi:hypothetical protein
MTQEHKEFLEFFKALKFTSEEDRALARRVALEDAAKACRCPENCENPEGAVYMNYCAGLIEKFL